MMLLPASDFTLQELTQAYNQTRTDYLIPMPMNPGRLQEYITLYDVDLSRSRVVVIGDKIVGLGMLGVRSDAGWITRLGVLPDGRRKGVGGTILNDLLAEAAADGLSEVWLEVISGNDPAYQLFKKFNFRETRELIVARRPPATARRMSAIKDARRVRYLQHEEVVELHCRRPHRENWLNSVESMRNVRHLIHTLRDDEAEFGLQHELSHLSGIEVEFHDGSLGWASFQATLLQLKRISVEVVNGDPARTTAGLLEMIHRLHSTQDAVIENIPDDACWLGYKQAGYFEVFRRIEMIRDTPA